MVFRILQSVTSRFPEEFYLENQWKSVPHGVFPEKHVIPGKLIESNLFKGLFCRK